MESTTPMTIATTTPGSHHVLGSFGLAYSAFGDLGATTTCQLNDATYKRKTAVKKNEE
jgi:hypothetical protein